MKKKLQGNIQVSLCHSIGQIVPSFQFRTHLDLKCRSYVEEEGLLNLRNFQRASLHGELEEYVK